ncbi:uncharacterized protein LOC127266183 [Andrographis paniculata]|uniref:uncharacterized protein LOC127266183 n=1 Tax=Andrographis paniculata TaxID=175694 RepID=UPI0021E88913|nr:uncharacterized protein LOC127266183 [Andrographis paniculata]
MNTPRVVDAFGSYFTIKREDFNMILEILSKSKLGGHNGWTRLSASDLASKGHLKKHIHTLLQESIYSNEIDQMDLIKADTRKSLYKFTSVDFITLKLIQDGYMIMLAALNVLCRHVCCFVWSNFMAMHASMG